MSFLGCLGPGINTDNKHKLLFIHNHRGRLYVTSTIGHTLWVLIKLPKWLNPSTTIASRTLRGSITSPPAPEERMRSNSTTWVTYLWFCIHMMITVYARNGSQNTREQANTISNISIKQNRVFRVFKVFWLRSFMTRGNTFINPNKH